MHLLAAMHLALMADSSSAGSVMSAYVTPVVSSLCVAASLVCVFFLVNGGMSYMTSAGKVENLDHAKRVIRNALIGLVIVLGAGVLTAILTHAYASSGHTTTSTLPALTSIKPVPVSNGLVNVIIKAITGVLNNIIQSIATPFLAALTFFTSSTPLMAQNSSVFDLWGAIVGITDAMFVLIVALLGFHVMSAATFGLDEIEFKHLLPRIGAIFLLINTSIFAIDGVIELSNAMISAITNGLGTTAVWTVLTGVVQQSGGLGVAALLIMVAFLIFAVMLLVYYVFRIVTLYVGAILSPLVLLLWLVPGFRDFSESAAKAYITTVFVLFVHVVILLLAASLFAGLIVGSPTQTPDTLMALVVGLATVIALLKTQGLMMQLSYVSIGPRTARKLGGQFVNGVSFFGSHGKSAVTKLGSTDKDKEDHTSDNPKPNNMSRTMNRTIFIQPRSTSTNSRSDAAAATPRQAAIQTRGSRNNQEKTGTTMSAPRMVNKSKEMEKTS